MTVWTFLFARLGCEMRPDHARQVARDLLDAADLCDMHGAWIDPPREERS